MYKNQVNQERWAEYTGVPSGILSQTYNSNRIKGTPPRDGTNGGWLTFSAMRTGARGGGALTVRL